MSEKDYSGITTSKIGKNAKINQSSNKELKLTNNKSKQVESNSEENNDLTEEQIKNYQKAGQIAKEVNAYAKNIISEGKKLAEIAEKIEAKIYELGGKIAFPVNLSINDIAAHYTPTLNDDKIAEGLIKVDIGVEFNGFISDTAFSLDLTSDKKYTDLVLASQKALNAALEEVKNNKENTQINNIGKKICETITNLGFSPIRNLSGHGLDEFQVHSGLTIPNYNNGNTKFLGRGAFAIEPFATNGAGIVYDGAGSNIYHLVREGSVRDNMAREILSFILEEKQTLPFSQREIEKKFGKRALFGLAMLKNSGIIEEYSQLIEQNHGIVSQAEKSLIIFDNKVEILGE